tara:strand:+ start:14912 stop:15292 length:381 start_codon:yes stop_codon:yes gene_type:complete
MAFAEVMLVSALEADTGFNGLAEDRIFPAAGTTGKALPNASYQRVSTTGTGDLTGGGSLDQVRLQVTSWAETALAALELAKAIRDCIAPEDDIGIATFITQQGATLDEETRHWGVPSDYFIWQERT